LVAVAFCALGAAGAAAAAGRGGWLRASASAAFRIFAASMMARASPSLEMCDRSITGLASTGGLLTALLLRLLLR
jgi:hypothetical protein